MRAILFPFTIFFMISGAPIEGAEIRLACAAVGVEFELCHTAAQEWSKRTGHSVRIVSLPNGSTEILSLYQQLLANRSGDIDVFKLDVTWAGILANHFVDLDVHYPPADRRRFFSGFLDATTVKGKLKAVPWFLDTGLLFYRRDLLEAYGLQVPETWKALGNAAAVIQEGERRKGNDRFWGFVFQGRAYEGLTCNALEWLSSSDGGTIVDKSGAPTVASHGAVSVLKLFQSWMGKLVPIGVLNYSEEESRGVFQSGNAAFLRNWPYVWILANADESALKGKVGVTSLPHGPGGTSVATLGGWSLAVSRYSAHREAAIDLVKHLTSVAELKRRLLQGGFNPTMPALYRDPQVLEANPFLKRLFPVFENAVARPSKVTGAKYPQVSGEFYNAVHRVLSGHSTPEAAMKQLDKKILEMSGGGNW